MSTSGGRSAWRTLRYRLSYSSQSRFDMAFERARLRAKISASS